MNHTRLSGAQHSLPREPTPLGTVQGAGTGSPGGGRRGGGRCWGRGAADRSTDGGNKTQHHEAEGAMCHEALRCHVVSPLWMSLHDTAEHCRSHGRVGAAHGAHPLPWLSLVPRGRTWKNKRRQEMSKFKVLENPTFYLLHFCDYINAETL